MVGGNPLFGTIEVAKTASKKAIPMHHQSTKCTLLPLFGWEENCNKKKKNIRKLKFNNTKQVQ